MRAPRRQFASPFVVTMTLGASLAAAAGCGASEPKCGPGCNPPGSFGPYSAMPDAAPAPAADAEPPALPEQDTAPADPTGPTSLSPLDDDAPQSTVWHLYKHGKKCSVEVQPQCRPMSTCNPPPPEWHAYPCPKDIAFDRPLVIIQPPNSTECTVSVSSDECFNMDTPCPPPRKVKCPW